MGHRKLEIDLAPGIWPLSWPMGLTLLRLFLLPIYLWLLLAAGGDHVLHGAPRHGALAILIVMAITDKLDGYLARKLNQASRIGALLDPVADKLLIASSVVVLSFEWVAGAAYRVPLAVVVSIYAKDLVVGIGSLTLLYTIHKVTIAPRLLGKLSMVLQLALVIATLLGPDLEDVARDFWRKTLVFLWISVVIVAVASMIDYVVQGCLQFRSERSHAEK